jgi:hypothetical protein
LLGLPANPRSYGGGTNKTQKIAVNITSKPLTLVGSSDTQTLSTPTGISSASTAVGILNRKSTLQNPKVLQTQIQQKITVFR